MFLCKKMFVEIILPKSIIILLVKNQKRLKILKNLMGGKYNVNGSLC